MANFKRWKRYTKRGIKNRYVPKNRRGRRAVRIDRVVRDVAKLKYALNSETKFINHNITTMSPTQSTPLFQAIDMPDTQGVALNQRIGAKVKLCHLSGKFSIVHQNYGNKLGNLTLTFHIIFLKNGMFAPDLESDPANYLMNPDFNGNFGELSYWNQQNYGNWFSVCKFKVVMRDNQPPSQSAYGLQTDQDGNNTNDNLVRQPITQRRYINLNKKITVHTEWGNLYNTTPQIGTSDIVKMKPYIYCTTDCPDQTIPSGTDQPDGTANDRIFLQGSCRFSFKDN